jgi:hypothetical protein
MGIRNKVVKTRFRDLLKQSRPITIEKLKDLIFKEYTDKKPCKVSLIKLYLNDTKILRNTETALFISFCKPYKNVTKDK